MIAAERLLEADERSLAEKQIPPAMWPELLDDIERSRTEEAEG